MKKIKFFVTIITCILIVIVLIVSISNTNAVINSDNSMNNRNNNVLGENLQINTGNIIEEEEVKIKIASKAIEYINCNDCQYLPIQKYKEEEELFFKNELLFKTSKTNYYSKFPGKVLGYYENTDGSIGVKVLNYDDYIFKVELLNLNIKKGEQLVLIINDQEFSTEVMESPISAKDNYYELKRTDGKYLIDDEIIGIVRSNKSSENAILINNKCVYKQGEKKYARIVNKDGQLIEDRQLKTGITSITETEVFNVDEAEFCNVDFAEMNNTISTNNSIFENEDYND